MAKIISFANQKGGVGKTTSAVNIAASLGVLGNRVLLIDLDPQGNTTSGVGISKKQLKYTSKEVLLNAVPVREAIVKTEFDNLSIIPTNIALAGAEFDVFDEFESEAPFCLKKALDIVQDEYDCVIVDCPPSLSMLTINSFTASDGIVVPMQCEFYALEGLSQLMNTIKGIKQKYNEKLTLTGILITMYNPRLLLSMQVINELRKHYEDKLFKTTISRNVKLTEAPGYGKPVYYYDSTAKGSKEYLAVAEELAKRL